MACDSKLSYRYTWYIKFKSDKNTDILILTDKIDVFKKKILLCEKWYQQWQI